MQYLGYTCWHPLNMPTIDHPRTVSKCAYYKVQILRYSVYRFGVLTVDRTQDANLMVFAFCKTWKIYTTKSLGPHLCPHRVHRLVCLWLKSKRHLRKWSLDAYE